MEKEMKRETILLTRHGVIRLPQERHGTWAYPTVKRVLDVAAAVALLLLLLLPLFLTSVLIRSESPGRAVFRQTRLGKNLRPFTVYKLRTMYASAPHRCPSASLAPEERSRWSRPIYFSVPL